MSDFNKAVDISPNSPIAYHNRAVIFYQLKQYDRALGDVKSAEELGAKVNPEFIRMLKEVTGE